MQPGQRFYSFRSKGPQIMSRIPFLISMFTVRALFGQANPAKTQSPPPNPVVQVKRTPAVPTTAVPGADSLVDHFDFGANVRALAHPLETPVGASAIAPAAHGQSAVPKDYPPTA